MAKAKTTAAEALATPVAAKPITIREIRAHVGIQIGARTVTGINIDTPEFKGTSFRVVDGIGVWVKVPKWPRPIVVPWGNLAFVTVEPDVEPTQPQPTETV